jgi:hypothetical protein
MRRNPHVRFGGRAEETDPPQGPHRASARSNHTAGTLSARTGATTKEIMARLGHASARAAMVYQHATEDRDRLIADRLSAMTIEAGLAPVLPITGRHEASADGTAHRSGTEVARRRSCPASS